jgi:formylglycine-generating enzyme
VNGYYSLKLLIMTPSLYHIPPFLENRLRRYEVNGYAFHTVVLEKGLFMMGGDNGEAIDREKPVHEVSIREDYELGIHLVTQGLWRAVTGRDWPKIYFDGDERPVESVSWDDICGEGGFLEKLNDRLRGSPQAAAGGLFALPTEAQWEYAARAGRYRDGLGQLYSISSRLSEVGWYGDNSGYETHAVAQKQANVLGLCDMSGNVWEWTADDWHDNYDKAVGDDRAWIGSPRGLDRVIRGGGWGDYSRNCRVACRGYDPPECRGNDIGFRLARSSRPQI